MPESVRHGVVEAHQAWAELTDDTDTAVVEFDTFGKAVIKVGTAASAPRCRALPPPHTRRMLLPTQLQCRRQAHPQFHTQSRPFHAPRRAPVMSYTLLSPLTPLSSRSHESP